MDVHDKATRSRNMKAIKSRDTKPEMIVRRALHSHGFRYRIAPENLAGKPDVWLAKWNAAIFVHGCFWHMHSCKAFRLPGTRQEFWQRKLEENRKRDQDKTRQLIDEGKRVLIVWECALKGAGAIPSPTLVLLIKTFLSAGFKHAEITSEGLINIG